MTNQALSSSRGGASWPLVELTLARLREFLREPEAIFWLFFFPIVMTIAMAMAFPSSAGRDVVVGVAAGEHAGRIRAALEGVPGVSVRTIGPAEEQRSLREGIVHIIVVPGTPPVYRFDPERDESRLARLTVDDALKRASGRPDPWEARQEPQTVAGSRYIDWLIPGLIGVGIMSNGMWSIGFGIVQTRMRKLLKRMIASPMRKTEFLASHLLARLLFLGPEVIVPLVFAMLVFNMPIHGSALAIGAVTLIGALAFGAIGLLLGSRARTFEGISGLMNLAALPMWILSGVFFSATNFPAVMQPFIQALPLTALIDALRAVILDGATIRGVANELVLLSLWALVPFSVALRIFSWR
jgi:ABC-type multidrug transport system permease subunit